MEFSFFFGLCHEHDDDRPSYTLQVSHGALAVGDDAHGSRVHLVPFFIFDFRRIEERRHEAEAVGAGTEEVRRRIDIDTGCWVESEHWQRLADGHNPCWTTGDAWEDLLDGCTEAVCLVELRGRATSGDARNVALRTPRHHLFDEAGHHDEACAGIHGLFGIFNAHDSAASEEQARLGVVLGDSVEASGSRERELAHLEAAVDGGVHRLAGRRLGGRAQHCSGFVLGDESADFVHIGL